MKEIINLEVKCFSNNPQSLVPEKFNLRVYDTSTIEDILKYFPQGVGFLKSGLGYLPKSTKANQVANLEKSIIISYSDTVTAEMFEHASQQLIGELPDNQDSV